MSKEGMNFQPEPINNGEIIEVQPKQLAVSEAPSAIVMPVVSSQEALNAWNAYLDLKAKIVEPNDIQVIQGKNFLKKSYWRKIATFFNLTVDLVNESHEDINGELVWNFACKATAPNGRSAIGTGSCSAFEKATIVDGKPVQKGKVTRWGRNESTGKSFPLEWEWEPAQPNSIHNIRTTAETRAWNRAVSNLVGGGEVSAEEVAQKPDDYIQPPAPEKQTPKPQQRETQPTQQTKPVMISENQRRAIFAISRSIGMTNEQLKAKFNLEHTSDLTSQRASAIIEELKAMQGSK